MSSFFLADAEADALADADGMADGKPEAEADADADIEAIAEAVIEGIALGRMAALWAADIDALMATEGLALIDAELDEAVLPPPPLPSSQATTDSDSIPKTARIDEPRMDVFS